MERPNRKPDLAISQMAGFVKSEFWFKEEIVGFHYGDPITYKNKKFNLEELSFNDWIENVMANKDHVWSSILNSYVVEQILLGESGDN